MKVHAVSDEDAGASNPTIWSRELAGRLTAFRAVAAREGGEYGRWASAQAAVVTEEIGRIGKA